MMPYAPATAYQYDQTSVWRWVPDMIRRDEFGEMVQPFYIVQVALIAPVLRPALLLNIPNVLCIKRCEYRAVAAGLSEKSAIPTGTTNSFLILAYTPWCRCRMRGYFR